MVIFLLLLFSNIFSFSLQTIQAVFFCDDYLGEIYVVEGDKLTKIANGWNGNWLTPYPFDNLNATPGDLIKFRCSNAEGGWAFGTGCFVLNGNCKCYNFDTHVPFNYSQKLTREHYFGSIHCYSSEIYILAEEEKKIDYYYQHYIPLDISSLTCNINNNIITAQYGINKDLKLCNCKF